MKLWSPIKAEGGPDFTSLLKTIKENGKEREMESAGGGNIMDGHMLWFLMRHLRRRRRRMRRRQRDIGEEVLGDLDLDDDDDDDDEGQSTENVDGDDDDDDDGDNDESRVVDCHPS